eukprot:gene10455-12172_t
MKSTVLAFALILTSFGLKAQSNAAGMSLVPLKEISGKTGQEVVVVDSVYSGRAFDNRTLLNIGGNFPNQLLTVVIDKNDYNNFEGDIVALYLHKRISVAGKVTVYNGKSQIAVTDPKKQLNLNLKWERGLYSKTQ